MERPAPLVLDASIVVKWFVSELDSPDALKIRDAHTNQEISLFAPDLLVYELANALRFRSSITSSDLKEEIESLFELDIALISPTAHSQSLSAALARTLDITVYEAAYLQLAQDLDCQLITSDKRFHEKARLSPPADDGLKKIAVLLKDYSAIEKRRN